MFSFKKYKKRRKIKIDLELKKNYFLYQSFFYFKSFNLKIYKFL